MLDWSLVAVAITIAAVWAVAWALYYHLCVLRLNYVEALYLRMWSLSNDAPEWLRTYNQLQERTHVVHALWRRAGIDDALIPYADSLGLYQVVRGQFSAKENWLMNHQPVQVGGQRDQECLVDRPPRSWASSGAGGGKLSVGLTLRQGGADSAPSHAPHLLQ